MLLLWIPVAADGRRRALHLMLATAFALLLSACAKPVPLPPPADVPYGNGRLWQVEQPGVPPSYVFGTMHVSDSRVYDLPEAIETAYQDADVLLVETDYRRPASRRQLEQYFDLPEGQSLIDLIGRSTYRKLQNLIFRHHLKLGNYFRQQPWVSWMALSDRTVDIGEREDEDKPVLDDWLVLRARKAGREVDYLESGLEQWRSLAAIPMDDQVAMLRAAIDTYYEARVRVDRVAVYLDGNFALSYALWQRRLGHLDPALAERYTARLLDERNLRMVERMLPHMEERSAFVAVGALHLPGEQGLLRLLEARGYSVTRLY